jgi:ubiquitin carboxyl-terminal hydrolase 7
LTLSRSMLYDVVATKVGEKLNASPQNIRFTAPGVSGTPKTVIRHLPNSTLMEMIQPSMYNGVNIPTLFYEVLDIPLSELETKKQVKITVLTPTLSEEKMYDMVLPKDNKISDLLQELERKGVNFESESGTRLPRIFEAVQNKFIRELDMNETLSALTDSAYCTLYAEVRKPRNKKKK